MNRLITLAATVYLGCLGQVLAGDWQSAFFVVALESHKYGANCQNLATASGLTKAHPNDAGRIAIENWNKEVAKAFGKEFANLKFAKEPKARCTQHGNDKTLTCTVRGFPCTHLP